MIAAGFFRPRFEALPLVPVFFEFLALALAVSAERVCRRALGVAVPVAHRRFRVHHRRAKPQCRFDLLLRVAGGARAHSNHGIHPRQIGDLTCLALHDVAVVAGIAVLASSAQHQKNASHVTRAAENFLNSQNRQTPPPPQILVWTKLACLSERYPDVLTPHALTTWPSSNVYSRSHFIRYSAILTLSENQLK